MELLKALWPYVSASAIALFTFIKWYFNHKEKVREKEIEELPNSLPDNFAESVVAMRMKYGTLWKRLFPAFRKMTEFVTYEIGIITYYMQDIVENTSSEHVILLKAHNGGGNPKVGNAMYSTVLYEWVQNSAVQKVQKRWHKQQLDENYIRMLMELINYGKVVLIVKDMKAGPLKDIYVSKGISFTEILKVYQTDEKLIYVSVAFTKPYEELTALERDEIRAGVLGMHNSYHKIRDIL